MQTNWCVLYKQEAVEGFSTSKLGKCNNYTVNKVIQQSSGKCVSV